MKKHLLTGLTLIFGFSAGIAGKAGSENNLQVVHVSGNVYNISKSKTLAIGDQVKSNDSLEFNSLNASCFVINGANSRYLLKPDQKLYVSAEKVMRPMSKRVSISTRSEGKMMFAPVLNLNSYFGTSNYVIFDTVSVIKLDTLEFKKRSNLIFIIKFKDKDGLVRSKKLDWDKDRLTLRWNQILPKDASGQTLDLPVELFIYNTATEDLIKKASFTPASHVLSTLEKELDVFVKTMGSNDKMATYEEMESFIQEFYGNFNPPELQKFLRERLNFAI